MRKEFEAEDAEAARLADQDRGCEQELVLDREAMARSRQSDGAGTVERSK